MENTWLEPACRNGAFLTEILRRKLAHCTTDVDVVRVVCSIYGVDIQQDNVDESKAAMLDIVLNWSQKHRDLFVLGAKAGFEDYAGTSSAETLSAATFFPASRVLSGYGLA